MKTTDLIPLILYELGEGDKYGFELSKSIETLSNGKIVIKQATLYTILKKLEKSKFISSYWQDSEIGGKRHYYKLTENGSLQLSTMPHVDVIIGNILSSDEASLSPNPVEETPSQLNNEKTNDGEENGSSTSSAENAEYLSIMDLVLQDSEGKAVASTLAEIQADENPTQPELKESVLPSEEVFKDEALDSLTETEINSSNASLLHAADLNKGEKFAENSNVSKFTENQPYVPLDLAGKLKSPKETFTPQQQIVPKQIENDEIKFVDYVNFKQSPKYIQANKLAKQMWCRILCSTAYLVLMLAISAIVSSKTSFSVLGNVFLILGILLAIFSPTIYAYKYQNFKTKCQEGKFKFDIKKRIIISVCLVLVVVLAVIITNISIGNSSISKMFSGKNFANIYVPLIISSMIVADLLFSYIFLRKSKN